VPPFPFSSRHSDIGAHLVLTSAPPRPVPLVAFAYALVDLGLIPDLTDPQARFLEALDGTRPPLTARDRVDTIRAAGRRHLRDLVAAHTLAIGHNVTLAARDARDAATARDEILGLAVAYLGSTGVEVLSTELAPLLHVFAPSTPDPKETPTCPTVSASSAPPGPPPPARSSAAPVAPRP
jgi:hypothetical protein